MLAHDIIIKPVISEKSLRDATVGKYTFMVNSRANKTEIKKAIEDVFEVKIIKIATNITKGSTTRNTRVGRKTTEFINKKARIMLTKGQSISIFNEHLGLDDEGNEKSKDKKAKSKKETVKKEASK